MLIDILDRIERRLKAVGLSATAASKQADLSPDAIRNIQRAVKDERKQGVSTRTLEALARPLQTTSNWLLTGEGMEEAASAVSVTSVPLISWVSAGRLQRQEGVSSLADAKRIAVADLGPGDWFALEVDGDSMDRISPPSSIIIVNRLDKNLTSNACYVISDERGDTSYKRYRPNPDRFEPVSVNPNHQTIFPDNMPHIIGRVRRSILDM